MKYSDIIKKLSEESIFSEKAILSLYQKLNTIKSVEFYVDVCTRIGHPLDLIRIHPAYLYIVGFKQDVEEENVWYCPFNNVCVMFFDDGICVVRHNVILNDGAQWLHELIGYDMFPEIKNQQNTNYKITYTADK